MTTRLQLAVHVRTWDELRVALVGPLEDLLVGNVSVVWVTVPGSGYQVLAGPLGLGRIRLVASGNETLTGEHRLNIQQERTLGVIGFKPGSGVTDALEWDWEYPADSQLLASGIARTFQHSYDVEACDVVVSVTV